MAKILYAYRRSVPFGPDDGRRLRAICRRLEPDNLSQPAAHQVSVQGRLAYGIVNHRSAVVRDGSILLGCVYGDDAGWERPGNGAPDGSYAILRNGDKRLELVSDAAGSRTLWYCFDDEHLVAATSQRAIVMFLGRFEFNDEVTPWMLSTGTLGPELSWDRRIRRLPPDASLLLDKRTWSISVRTRPIVFVAAARSDAQHKALLTEDIRTAVQSLKRSSHVRFDDYLLPLSGGYDSRALLCFLSEGGRPANLKAITWGLERNVHRTDNDAAVASALARRLGVPHRYFHTDVSEEPLATVIDRFVQCGEGRVDHLAAYMDGMETWRKLREEEGCGGIIRGDEGFGWNPVSTEQGVRLSVGIGLCADYRNLESLAAQFHFPEQTLPPGLGREEGETLSAWRDRLYHVYRLPTVLAALSDLKYSYVEVINPLLARSILHRVRALPDRLRTGKALFKDIVRSVSPAVPFAKEGANASPASLLGRSDFAALMRDEIRSDGARRIFDQGFLECVLQGVRDESGPGKDGDGKAWRGLKALVPRFIKARLRQRVAKPSLEGNVLAFRVFLMVRMRQLLEADRTAVAAAAGAEPMLHGLRRVER